MRYAVNPSPRAGHSARPCILDREVGVGRFALGQETVAQRGRPDNLIIEPEQLPGPMQARIGKDGPKEKHAW